MARIAVIGSGFSGLSAAAHLGKLGHEVTLFEKNPETGGRARQWHPGNGFVFDMGPSWYWMPGVFERFFAHFGKKVEDLYTLKLLQPSFDIVFGKDDVMSVPDRPEELRAMFERIEPGSGPVLDRFMEEAAYKYRTGIDKLVYKPGLSLREFADWDLIRGVFRLQVFSPFSRHVRSRFRHPQLRALMEFPVLFLGAMPEDTPALYSLMNYAGLHLGTWYPMGGFGKVVDAMVEVAKEQGVKLHTHAEVQRIVTRNGRVTGVQVGDTVHEVDAVISSADYHHTEQKLLAKDERNYPAGYWDKRTFAPSSLIYYIGVKKKLDRLHHHTLFFEESLQDHAVDIYREPRWPAKPLFYACAPSRTDDSVAPEGHENLFLLMPLAPGLEDGEDMREKYFHIMMDRLEAHAGTSIRDAIVLKRSYCVSDFIRDYHSCKGNAYGLANTLRQTAILKPSIRNRKLSNLFYTGQLTVPGPGVPPALVSGEVSAQLLHRELQKNRTL